MIRGVLGDAIEKKLMLGGSYINKENNCACAAGEWYNA
jgi:hypothetical protein